MPKEIFDHAKRCECMDALDILASEKSLPLVDLIEGVKKRLLEERTTILKVKHDSFKSIHQSASTTFWIVSKNIYEIPVKYHSSISHNFSCKNFYVISHESMIHNHIADTIAKTRRPFEKKPSSYTGYYL